jgi:hypothetical protein
MKCFLGINVYSVEFAARDTTENVDENSTGTKTSRSNCELLSITIVPT